MKTILPFMLVFALLVGCDLSDDEKQIPVAENQLYGFWQLNETMGFPDDSIWNCDFIINFKPDNSVELYGGLNSGSAKYRLENNTLYCNDLIFSERSCRMEVYRFEALAANNLHGNISLENDTLIIVSDKSRLSFVPIDTFPLYSNHSVPIESYKFSYCYESTIEPNEFFSEDPFYDKFSQVYGKWYLELAYGGWGTIPTNFETLEIIQNGIYTCNCGGCIVEYGQISIEYATNPIDTTKLKISFKPAYLPVYYNVGLFRNQTYYYVSFDIEKNMIIQAPGWDSAIFNFKKAASN